MSRLPEFPSNEQFLSRSGHGKALPIGDRLRDVIATFPVVERALLVPSAEEFARAVGGGLRPDDLGVLAERAGEHGVTGFYRAATGFPAIPHSGHVVDLSAVTTSETLAQTDPLSTVRAANPHMQTAVAEALAKNHSRTELLGIAQALITQATMVQS